MRLAQVAAVTVMLAGCGDGGGFEDAPSVAKAAGCRHVTSTHREPYAADAATCEFNGAPVTVSWFRGTEAFKNWLNWASESGKEFVHGYNWAIECVTKADCNAMKDNAS